GLLSAHEAKSSMRHRLVMDELATIQKILGFLDRNREISIDKIDKYEEQYRKQVNERHGFITPPHFDAARKIPINDLYVIPDILRLPRRKGDELARLATADFLAQSYRGVLLGNPGGGKSTFAQKLCCDLTLSYGERVFGGRRVTPVLVIL